MSSWLRKRFLFQATAIYKKLFGSEAVERVMRSGDRFLEISSLRDWAFTQGIIIFGSPGITLFVKRNWRSYERGRDQAPARTSARAIADYKKLEHNWRSSIGCLLEINSILELEVR